MVSATVCIASLVLLRILNMVQMELFCCCKQVLLQVRYSSTITDAKWLYFSSSTTLLNRLFKQLGD